MVERDARRDPAHAIVSRGRRAARTAGPRRVIAPAGPRVAAVVLAAGESRRMGSPKQLLPFGEQTMLERVVATLRQVPVGRLYVVLGHRAGEIAASTPGLLHPDVVIVVNSAYLGGMFTSVRAGVVAAGPAWDAYCLALADQPLVEPDAVRALIAGFAAARPALAIPTWEGRKGHPLLLRGDLHGTIVSAPEDWTLREVRELHAASTLAVPVTTPGILEDADTPADYQRLRARA